MTARKKSNSAKPSLPEIVKELDEVMATISQAAEAALQNSGDTVQTKKAAERMLRAAARGVSILDTLRSEKEK